MHKKYLPHPIGGFIVEVSRKLRYPEHGLGEDGEEANGLNKNGNVHE